MLENKRIYGILLDIYFSTAEVYNVMQEDLEPTLKKILNCNVLYRKQVWFNMEKYEIIYSQNPKSSKIISCYVGEVGEKKLEPVLSGCLWICKPNNESLNELDIREIMENHLGLLKNKTTKELEMKLYVDKVIK